MARIYDRERLFQKNIVDGRSELDLGSMNFRDLVDSEVFTWTRVKSTEQCRPDLLSYRLYGTDELWWFVMWLNGISDPWHDLMPDVVLKYIAIDKIENAFKRESMR